MKKMMFTTALMFSLFTWAAPAAKYEGTLVVPNRAGPHKNGINSKFQLMFDGEALTQVTLKNDQPLFGQTDFVSTEQEVVSRVDAAGVAVMTVIFKLDGPRHDWYYVVNVKTTDQGKTYSGKFYGAQGTLAEIKAAVAALADIEAIPANWGEEGPATLKAL